MCVQVVKIFNFKLFTLFILLNVFFTELVLAISKNEKVSFQFPEYDYKETSKNVSKINKHLHINSILSIFNFLYIFV